MSKKPVVVLLALLLLLVGAIGALAASKRVCSHTLRSYSGKTSAGTPVRLKIEFDFNDPGRYNNSTWITSMTFNYPSCGSGSSLTVNGGIRAKKKTHTFSYRRAPAYANKNGYVEIEAIRGRVSGWDKKKLSWKKATGTVRVAYAQPAYTDDYGDEHPAYRCDHTYGWTVTRRR
jgi:hypothetical protein